MHTQHQQHRNILSTLESDVVSGFYLHVPGSALRSGIITRAGLGSFRLRANLPRFKAYRKPSPKKESALRCIKGTVLQAPSHPMTIFSVHHTTTYRYKDPIRPGLHQLMFRPRDSFDQRLLDCSLKVKPEPVEIRWMHDVFGNCITQVDFNVKTTSLSFETLIRLDHTPENTPDFRIEDYARTHPFNYADEELPDLTSCIRRHHQEDTVVEDWLGKFFTGGQSAPTGLLLMTLNEAIAESFSYQRRTSHGTQTPKETIERQEGTCRDFALLMMEAARSLGFAARFVTGYVYVAGRDSDARLGGGSTHAWCQIYLPGSGWVEFDPTNGIVGNRDLIRVGVARTPRQAIPLSGTYWGDPEDELGMDVSVQVKTEANV
jgi:transglutaminase-like putative cysteine protease